MKHQHIRIKKFGPIGSIDIELKRFTFFIGLQGIGKSTVAKVVSYCMWIEKVYSTMFSDEMFSTKEKFMNRLLMFHKLNGYCKPETEIYFETDFIYIEYTPSNFKIEQKNKYEYKQTKILYVPAERNLVLKSELEKATLGDTSFRSFLFDWSDARKNYSRQHPLDVLNLGVSFFSEEIDGVRENRLIHKNGSSFEIQLSQASSGMQSVVPLEVVVEYFSSGYYIDNSDSSFFYKEKQQKIYTSVIKEYVLNNENIDTEESFLKISKWLNGIAKGEKTRSNDKIFEVLENLLFTHSTQFVIEEPEQNLYPTTQKDFLAFLIACCNAENRKHSCLITTHSPFLLNYLTLFVKASQILNKCNGKPKKALNKLVPLKSVIESDEFEIFEFSNGYARKLLKQFDLPSDENLLNRLLEETNVDFGRLLELEDLCQK